MDLFDLIGPVMIGPSSSHTAGAARIGLTAYSLLGERVVKADVGLHGSFAKTYRGHGTDRAIVGGLLGMHVDDPRLRDSLEIARQQGMDVRFEQVNLRGAHPNTVRLHVTGERGTALTLEAARRDCGGYDDLGAPPRQHREHAGLSPQTRRRRHDGAGA